jgi:decaprenyl-phosphate phosphoribosyltransferase
MLKNFLKLIRVNHFIKNLLIFAPLFFSLNFEKKGLFFVVAEGFFVFSVIASAVYILNDIFDINEDKNHPAKKYRPVASGVIPIKQALYSMSGLLIIGFPLAYLLNKLFFFIMLFYFCLNVLYSLKLKHIVIIDIFVIAVNYILRILAGCVLINISPSMWIIIITYLLALFLALGKRRSDILLSGSNSVRKCIDGYNSAFVDSALGVICSCTLISYILYTISPEITIKMHSDYLYLTSFFVLAGILRYLQIIYVENKSECPTEIILKDKFLQVTILCWIILFWILIYL